MTYTCEGCGATYEGTAEDAYRDGWDTPETFMQHVTCPFCTIDKTAWWRVHKGIATDADIALIKSYMEIWRNQ